MTIADQLRSFPVPPRHVLIAAAGEIERLRRENERLKSYEAIYERLVHFENEATHLAAERDALLSDRDAWRDAAMLKGAERDALRQRVTDLEAGRA